MTPRVQKQDNYYFSDLGGSGRINKQLCAIVCGCFSAGAMRGTHYFDGRYENLYLDRAAIPAVDPVLYFAATCAAQVLHRPRSGLRCGFWFNRMMSGDTTGRHTHDDGQELLSGVYYVNVPTGAGRLVLYADHGPPVYIDPVPGRLLLFPPDAAHEVERGKFDGARLSVGMNFGARD